MGIIPLFGSPHKPLDNPHIEGHNRAFNDKTWNQNRFANPEQIDVECERFNQKSMELFDFRYRGNLAIIKKKRCLAGKSKIEFAKLQSVENQKIYFIRFAENKDAQKNSFIAILNEKAIIPEQYGHQFVFMECDVEKNRLNIFS